jgi:TonB-linked SusC/RagA family outer membrane protein
MCTIWGFIFSFVTATALMAGTTSAQSVKEVVISVQFDDASLQEAFNQIEQKTAFKFLYEKSFIETNHKRITLHQTTSSVEKILFEISKQTGLGFRQVNNTLAVKTPEEVSNTDDWLQFSEAISGSVMDAETGEPLPGVNIRVKGTSTGTSTNTEGYFELNVPTLQDTLVFSYIGFVTKEVALAGRTTLNITLSPDYSQLGEVFVVAYGQSTKESFTGSADVVDESTLKDVPRSSFQDALTGKAAGVSVTTTSGQVGSTPSIQIRGVGSMNASTQPLYVVDGVPVVAGNTGQLSDYIYATNNVMNTLNPNDIESISILKDAAASSLYGSRAANGVVLITTKRGKSGKPKINFRSSIAITPAWATDNYEPASTQENVNYLYRVFHDYKTSSGKSDADANAWALSKLDSKFNKHGYYFETDGTGVGETVHIKGLTDGVENREGDYYDWEDAYFRTAVYQTNDISVSGGNETTKYYSSLSYTKDQGRVKINGYDRITGRVNLSQKVGKRLDIITNVNIANTNLSGFNDTRSTSANYYEQTRNLLWGLYHPTDYKTGEPYTNRFGSYAQNNVYYDNEWDNSSETFRITANESILLKILPTLDFKTVFSYDNVTTKDEIYYSRIHYYGEGLGTLSNMITSTQNIVSSSTLNYAKSFGKQRIDLLGGFEVSKNQTDYQRASGQDLPSSALHTVITAGELDASGYYWGNNMLSMLSRVEYNYDLKYFLSASFRRDGSSKLGPDTRWGNFWSLAGAWNLDQEKFMEGQDLFTSLRVKASYGVNGTLPPSNYGWRSLTSYTSNYMGNAGGELSNAADANLSWETNYTYNLGVEFGMFDQRLYGTIEYFNRDSKDLLQSVPISRVTGFSTTLKNIGSINNKGIELQLGGDIIRTDLVKWTLDINGSFTNSKVTDLYEGADIIWYSGVDAYSKFIYREGESTRAFYGYEYAGVDKSNGLPQYYVNDPNDDQAGDFLLNGRGATNDFRKANDVIIGNAIPDVFGGINTSVQYKGINLALNFNYKLGGELYDGAEKDVADDGYYWERIRSQYAYDDMWTPENPNGGLPRVSGNDPTDAIQKSSRHIYDASFLRLKNITLGYNLPMSVLDKVGIDNARVYVSGTNLLTFSKYKHADPEVNSLATRGWETPYGKTYSFGIEIGF